MDPETQNVERANEGTSGPIIGTIIILVVIILGGLYFWGQRGDEAGVVDETINTPNEAEELSGVETELNVDGELDAE
jgi:hypothetical protein